MPRILYFRHDVLLQTIAFSQWANTIDSRYNNLQIFLIFDDAE